MTIIKPARLQKGDTITIVAPSRPIDAIPNSRLQMKRNIRALEKWGYVVKKGKHLALSYYLTAGSPEERAADLVAAFEDKDTKFILAASGGFLANELLPHIDFNAIKKNPKIFCGMSDISTLLNPIVTLSNLACFHGPTLMHGRPDVWSMVRFGYGKDYFFRAVADTTPVGKVKPLSEWQRLNAGKATGEAIGGNLTVVKDLIGTKYEPNWKNKILFLEEIGEAPETILHDLVAMKHVGVFDKVRGVVLGHFEKCWSSLPWQNMPLPILFKEFFEDYSFPVLKIEEFGHNCPNITLPMGCKVTVDATTKHLFLEESAVK